MTTRSIKARRRREGGDISMFPFLAVLICTMGALILLLIIITHQAAAQAKREAVEEHSQRKVDLAEQREDAAWRRDILKNSLLKTREKLAELRQKLGYLENDTSRLRGEVIELAKTLKQLEKQKPTSENSAELNARLARLQAKIVTARRKLDEEMKKAIGKSKSYAVVPYSGPNETRRHPIYVECRSDGVVIQPEGIRLGESDFEGFFGPDNPLAAALRAKAGYLQQRYRFSKNVGRPYPLLLVRQSGIESYCAAMDAMKSWDSEFGYELIDDDMKLDFTEPDMRLKQLVQQEIEHARRKKQALARALPRVYNDPTLARSGGGSGGRRYYTVSSGKGGVVPYNGDIEEIEPSRSRRSTSSRQGYPSAAERYGANHTGDGSGSYPSVTSKDSPSNLASAQPYGSAPYGSGPNATNSYVNGQGGSSNSPSILGKSASASPDTAPRLLGASGSPGTSRTYPSQDTPRLLTPPNRGTEGQYGQGYNPSQGKSKTGTESVAGQDGAGQAFSGYGDNQQGVTQGQGSTQAQGQSQAQGQPQGQQGMASAANPNGAASGAACQAGGPPCSASGNPSPLSMSAPGAPSSPMAGQTAQAPLGVGEWQPNSGNPNATTSSEPRAPDPFAPAHRSHAKRPKSIAKERGKDWCLPKESAYRVPLSRPVSIDCYPDRFVFRAKRGGLAATTIQLDNQTGRSVNEFVSAVWDRVESWGMAGQGMYWKPVLMVRVQPGGEGRFADLQALFHESGFKIEKKK